MTTTMADGSDFDPAMLWSQWSRGGKGAQYAAWKTQVALNAMLPTGAYGPVKEDGIWGSESGAALKYVTGSYWPTQASLQVLDAALRTLPSALVQANQVRYYGVTALWDEDLTSAQGYLLYSMQLYPNTLAAINLGQLHERQGQWTQAVQDWQFVAANTAPTTSAGQYGRAESSYASYQAAGGQSQWGLVSGGAPTPSKPMPIMFQLKPSEVPGTDWWTQRSTAEKAAIVAGGVGLVALIGSLLIRS